METANGNAENLLVVKKQKPILIRPAAETRKGLHFLSNLDQLSTNSPVELVFVFRENKENATETLKESLAKILVEFYPFAGCLATTWDGKMMVRCSGEGVPFIEAASDNEIQVLGDICITNPKKLRKLIHFVEGLSTDLDKPLLTIQVTRFRCGGIVLGVALNHIICDNKSLMDFILSWGEIARGKPPAFHPYLDRSLLSPRQPPQVNFPHHEFFKKEEIHLSYQYEEPLICRSFCFDPKKLAQLKKMAYNNDYFPTPPTTFEVISALAWIFRTKAFMIEPHQYIHLLIVADARAAFKPPLPEAFFGNVLASVCAQCTAGELLQKPFWFAVKVVREAIKMVSEEYVRSTIDYYQVTRAKFVEGRNTCYVTKLSRLPFYETDFGWGKPTQVAPALFEHDAILILSQGKDSQNTIMSLSLPESAMKIFEEMMNLELPA